MPYFNAPVFFGQRHIAPWLPQLSAQYPKLQIDLSLTDDFINPHYYATDITLELTPYDSVFHAHVFGEQTHHLAASPAYIATQGKLQVPADLQLLNLLVSNFNSAKRVL